MSSLAKVTLLEAKLFLRDPLWAACAVGLPTVLLAVFASIPAMAEPSASFGGMSFVAAFSPSLVVITLGILAFQALPGYVAGYREKGILRRMSVTPVHPAVVLAAQLLVHLVTAVVALALLLAVGRIGFDVPLPRHGLGFAVAFVLGMTALFALSLLVAAVAPSARTASGISFGLFIPTMFFGGVYVPRELLPDSLARIGGYLPPGVEALQEAWTGSGPSPVQLAVLAAVTVAGGTIAAKMFRWE